MCTEIDADSWRKFSKPGSVPLVGPIVYVCGTQRCILLTKHLKQLCRRVQILLRTKSGADDRAVNMWLQTKTQMVNVVTLSNFEYGNIARYDSREATNGAVVADMGTPLWLFW